MKRLLITCVLFCTSVGVSAGEEAPSSAVVRNALVVADLDVSKNFYSSALGFTPGFDGDISGEWVNRLLQLHEGSTVRFVVRNARWSQQ